MENSPLERSVADGVKGTVITFSVCSLVCFDSQSAMCQRFGNMPKAKALKNHKIVNEVKILWRLLAVGNGSKIPLFDFFSAFAEGLSLRYGVVFLVGGLEEFGAEGVVVAEVFEVGGGGVGFEGGGVGGEGIVTAHHTL